MTDFEDRDPDRIAARQSREDFNIFSRLPAVYAASRKQGQNLLRAGGSLSIVEWRTLWDLAEVGPMSIRDLAAIQRADHSLLSRALPEMKRKGYVDMRQDAQDKRQTIVCLTPDGRAAYDRAAPIMAGRRAALREAFSQDEIKTFIAYLDRLDAFLRQPVETILKKDTAE